MKYAIIENNKCMLIDDDINRLKNTLIFMPQYTLSDIQELQDNAVEPAYNGEWWLKGYAPQIPQDKAKELRALAYAKEIDCITAHIQRLRDENPLPQGEINELIAERDEKVAAIKARYPYIEEENN